MIYCAGNHGGEGNALKRAILFLLALLLAAPGQALCQESRDEAWEMILASLGSDEPEPVPENWLLPPAERGLRANPELDARIMNVLLMSTDAGDLRRNRGRTDVMALCSVNLDSGGAAIVILPETRLMQAGGLPGEIRLKYMNCFGGPLWVAQTLNEWLHLNVKRYCAVNEEALIRAVDVMGGAALLLNETEAEALGLSPGENTLTGEQALRFVRLRRASNAWERPRQLIMALFGSAQRKGLEQTGGLIDQLLPLIDTNLTSSDVMNLLLALLGNAQSPALRTLLLPQDTPDGAAWCLEALYGE